MFPTADLPIATALFGHLLLTSCLNHSRILGIDLSVLNPSKVPGVYYNMGSNFKSKSADIE